MKSLDYHQYRAMSRFPALDGLRGIAALLVIDFHFDHRWPWLSGWLGVHIFFVLSGFLISTLMFREEAAHGKVSLRNFYVRRVFRIVPVYLVVLAAGATLAWRSGGFASIREPLLHYLTFTNEFADPSFYVHTWTIGIEQKFYLVWPILAVAVVAITRVRLARTAATASMARVVVTAVVVMTLAVLAFAGPKAVSGLSAHYTGLLLGCLLAALLHDPRAFRVLRVLASAPVAPVTIGLWAVVHCSILTLTSQPMFGLSAPLREPQAIVIYDLAVVLMLPALLRPGLPARLLGARAMAFLGDRSYSLYLIQILAGSAAAGLLPGLGFGKTKTVLVTIVALVAADVLYRWVEVPMIKVGRRFTRRPTPPREREPAQDPAAALVPAGAG